MLKQILNLSKSLISIPSVKDDCGNLELTLNLAKNELSEFNFKEFKSNQISSLLFYNTPNPTQKFKIILNAHLDVVPGKPEQFAPFEKNGKLYGRGACDMKAAAAVIILVFKEVAKKIKYPLGLQIVTDEEIGGFNGTKYQLENNIKTDFIIAGESTDFGINNKAKGIIWAKIITKGKTAHGAYPWNGNNAIWKMKQFLDNLQKAFPVPNKELWVTTVNVASINTKNKTFSQVPEDCEILLDIRFVPEDESIIKKTIEKIIPNNASIEIIENEPAQFADENNPYILSLKKTIEKYNNKKAKIIVKHGGSDIRFYSQAGSLGITFGPIGKGLHSDEEYVDIKSLDSYYHILKEYLFAFNN